MSSPTYTYLITGCSRGLGLEMVRLLITSPYNIILATCRDPFSASALQRLGTKATGTLHILPMDVSNVESIEACSKLKVVRDVLGVHGLDYLINSAGVLEDDTAFTMSITDLAHTMATNVGGPAAVAQVYLPYLERSQRKVIMNMTSGLGSIALGHGRKNASYSISKTAINMLTYKQATERPDLIVFCIDPGWVKTDMGGPNAELEPEVSVAYLIRFLDDVTEEHTGKFFRFDGKELPW